MVLVDATQAPNLAPGSGGVACLQMTRAASSAVTAPLVALANATTQVRNASVPGWALVGGRWQITP